MQEIECINRELVLPTVHPSQQSIEIWGPISTEEAQLGIQDRGMRRNGRQRLLQERQPFRPIVTAPTVEADLATSFIFTLSLALAGTISVLFSVVWQNAEQRLG